MGEIADADGAGVRNEQKRNGQPERELPCLRGGNAQMPAAIQRAQAERAMEEKRAIERKQADQCLPGLEQEDACRLHRLD